MLPIGSSLGKSLHAMHTVRCSPLGRASPSSTRLPFASVPPLCSAYLTLAEAHSSVTEVRGAAGALLAPTGSGLACSVPCSVRHASATSHPACLRRPPIPHVQVKKSKFIAHAWPCSSAEEAARLIDSRRDPSASHNCWAYKVGRTAAQHRAGSRSWRVRVAGARDPDRDRGSTEQAAAAGAALRCLGLSQGPADAPRPCGGCVAVEVRQEGRAGAPAHPCLTRRPLARCLRAPGGPAVPQQRRRRARRHGGATHPVCH